MQNQDEIFKQLIKKTEAPVIFLESVVIFPRVVLPLVLKKQDSILALEEAMRRDRLVVFVLKNSKGEASTVGTAAYVSQAMQALDGSVKVLIEGMARADVKSFIQEAPYARAKFSLIKAIHNEEQAQGINLQALISSVLSQFKECINSGKIVPLELLVGIYNVNEPSHLADLLAFSLDLRAEERQEILEIIDPVHRLSKLSEYLVREREILRTGQKLEQETSEKLSKISKEVYLREQLQSIKKELGIEKDPVEIDDYRTRLKAFKGPKKVKQTIEKEIGRLEKMPTFSPEVSYLRTYLDLLFELPWGVKDEKPIDIKKAEAILN